MSATENDFERVEQILAGADADTTAAEVDGRLLSLGAMLGAEAAPFWLSQVAETARGPAAAMQPLVEIAARRLQALDASDALLVPWLPEDQDSLLDRVEAVVDWAGGFLAGLGEGAALRGSPARERLEVEPMSELVADLSEITRATISAEEIAADPEAAESAYTEIVEYLRVVAQLAYEELSPVRSLAAGDGAHVH